MSASGSAVEKDYIKSRYKTSDAKPMSTVVTSVADQLGIKPVDVWRLYTALDSQSKGWVLKEHKEPGSTNAFLRAFDFMLETLDQPLSIPLILDVHKHCLMAVDMRNSRLYPHIDRGHLQATGLRYGLTLSEYMNKKNNEAVFGRALPCIDKITSDSRECLIEISSDPILARNALQDSINDYYNHLSQAQCDDDKLLAIIQMIKDGNLIHGLPDANGRSWLILLNKLLKQNRFPFVLLFDPMIFRGLAPEEILPLLKKAMAAFQALQQGALPSTESIVAQTPSALQAALFNWAAASDSSFHLPILQQCITLFDSNVVDVHGNTPLINAVFNQNIAAVATLLASPTCEVNQTGQGDLTAMDWAIYRNNTDILSLLASHNALASNKPFYGLFGSLQYSNPKKKLVQVIEEFAPGYENITNPLKLAMLYVALSIVGNHFPGWERIYKYCCEQLQSISHPDHFQYFRHDKTDVILSAVSKIQQPMPIVVKIFNTLKFYKPQLFKSDEEKFKGLKAYFNIDDDCAVLEKIKKPSVFNSLFGFNDEFYCLLTRRFPGEPQWVEQIILDHFGEKTIFNLLKRKATFKCSLGRYELLQKALGIFQQNTGDISRLIYDFILKLHALTIAEQVLCLQHFLAQDTSAQAFLKSLFGQNSFRLSDFSQEPLAMLTPYLNSYAEASGPKALQVLVQEAPSVVRTDLLIQYLTTNLTEEPDPRALVDAITTLTRLTPQQKKDLSTHYKSDKNFNALVNRVPTFQQAIQKLVIDAPAPSVATALHLGFIRAALNPEKDFCSHAESSTKRPRYG